MSEKLFGSWIRKFVIFAVIVFIVLEAFEYAVFGGLLYFSSVLLGYTIPSVIVYSVLLGIVFATAQHVLSPRSIRSVATAPSVRPASIAPMPRKSKPKRSAPKPKKKAKKRRRK